MQCPQCHQQVENGEGFCWNCGARLPQEPSTTDTTRVAGMAPAPVAPPAPGTPAPGAVPPAPAYGAQAPSYDPSMYEETVAGPIVGTSAVAPAAPSAAEATTPTGAAVPPPSTAPATPPNNGGKKPKSNRGLLITLIVLVVIMIAAIGFWIWQSTRANDDAASQGPSSSQTSSADAESASTQDEGDADDKSGKDDKDKKDEKKDAKCTATPDVDVDDLTASGDSLIATLSLSTKSCETGSYAEPNVKITVKNDDGDVIAAAVYDFSKKPIDFEDGEASAPIAFNSRQHWQPADEITSPTNAKVIWQTNQQGEGKPSGDVEGALGGASIDTVDNERYAQLALKRQLDDDSSQTSAFYSDYTTQLSSKKYNMNIDGKAWKYTDIYEQFLKLHYKHPNAILIWASDYYNYTKHGHAADYYVILSGETFSRAEDATAWCSSNGYAAEDCVAVDLE